MSAPREKKNGNAPRCCPAASHETTSTPAKTRSGQALRRTAMTTTSEKSAIARYDTLISAVNADRAISSRSRIVRGGSNAEKRSRNTMATNLADRKSTRLNSSHGYISYAVFCLKKKKKNIIIHLEKKKKKKNKNKKK